MKAGKMTLSGTTVTPDSRKGLLVLRKDDGLMHLIWKDRTTGTVEEDLIIFQGDATLRHVPQCTDGFGMLLEFTTGRRFFFWSQEPRNKELGWSAEDAAKELEKLNQANAILNGTPTAAAPSPSSAAPGGFDGMTHSELMTMLSGGAAAAPTPAAAAPSPTAAAPAPTDVGAAPSAVEGNAAAALPAAPAFSADSIASAMAAAAAPPAAPGAPAPAAAAFSADSIASLLGSITQPTQPVSLNAVLSADATIPLVDASMEASLSEHIPPGSSVTETLQTPQLQQAAQSFTEALHSGDAAGIIAEMGLNPAGHGVEPFLRALQAATPASAAPAAASDAGGEAMDNSDGAAAEPKSMEE